MARSKPNRGGKVKSTGKVARSGLATKRPQKTTAPARANTGVGATGGGDHVYASTSGAASSNPQALRKSTGTDEDGPTNPANWVFG